MQQSNMRLRGLAADSRPQKPCSYGKVAALSAMQPATHPFPCVVTLSDHVGASALNPRKRCGPYSVQLTMLHHRDNVARVNLPMMCFTGGLQEAQSQSFCMCWLKAGVCWLVVPGVAWHNVLCIWFVSICMVRKINEKRSQYHQSSCCVCCCRH